MPSSHHLAGTVKLVVVDWRLVTSAAFNMALAYLWHHLQLHCLLKHAVAALIFVATWTMCLCSWVSVCVCVREWLVMGNRYKYVIFAVEPFALIAFGQRVV